MAQTARPTKAEIASAIQSDDPKCIQTRHKVNTKKTYLAWVCVFVASLVVEKVIDKLRKVLGIYELTRLRSELIGRASAKLV